MQIGISSSCFYPILTEQAFRKVGELGAKTAEIFFNCASELGGSLLKELVTIKDYYGIEVRSIHPYSSFAEPYTLFSPYRRRSDETLEFYKKYSEAAAALGAECFVIHGGKKNKSAEEEEYFEIYGRLCEISKPYGVLPAHENVNLFCGENIDFLLRLKEYTGEDFRTVLDIKQCRRCGTDEFEIIEKFEGSIIQVHISDFNNKKDCIPPGEGEYDFGKLFSSLKKHSYDKSAIIELYNWGYDDESQIVRAKRFLEKVEKDV